jgi:hypothetical protein
MLGVFFHVKDETIIKEQKALKGWSFPGNKSNRMLLAANNIIKYVYINGNKEIPSADTLFYFLSKINEANFSIVIADLTPSNGKEQDDYYKNFFIALDKVNKKNKFIKLKCLVCDNRLFGNTLKETENLLRKYYSRDDVYGFAVDEPREKDFKHLASWTEYFRSLKKEDPIASKLFFVNLYGVQAEDNYISYINSWLSIGKPSILSFDNYSVWDDNLAGNYGDGIGSDWAADYFYNFEIYRQASLLNHIPFVNWILIHKHYSSYSKRYYRRATAEDLRFQVYSSLAYGSKGIFYYNFWNPPPKKNKNSWHEEYGILNYDGSVSELYNPVKKINEELALISDTLLQLSNIGTYQNYNSISTTNKVLEKKFDISSSDPKAVFGIRTLSDNFGLTKSEINNKFIINIDNVNALVGLFKDSAENRFFILVNKDRKKAEEFIVTFDKNRIRNTNKIYNFKTGEKLKYTGFDKNKNPFIKITLSAGDGTLFGVIK